MGNIRVELCEVIGVDRLSLMPDVYFLYILVNIRSIINYPVCFSVEELLFVATVCSESLTHKSEDLE